MGMSAPRAVVLCVDDETAILHALRRVFLDEPWETLFATSGEEGLRMVAEHDIDIVLADFRMPGMDGVEFLDRVQAIRPDCLRVVLSGYADIALIVAALNEGRIYRFLSKPWNDDELRDHVRKFLDHQRLDRENRRLNAELMGLNGRLEQRIGASAETTRAKERTIEFVRFALESLPLALVCVNGLGDLVMVNAEARRLLRTPGTEPLDRALAAATEGARRSPTGYHAEPFGAAGEMPGMVVATAGTEPLHLAAPKAEDLRAEPGALLAPTGKATEASP
jgi:two-component system NtrC family sensor kinase